MVESFKFIVAGQEIKGGAGAPRPQILGCAPRLSLHLPVWPYRNKNMSILIHIQLTSTV